MYCIVHFTNPEDLSYELVPQTWISDDESTCKWPKTDQLRRFIKDSVEPTEEWETCKIDVLRNSICKYSF